MRIQAGWAKGTELAVPKGEATRPTSAKVRAAAVNMLAPYMGDGSFLDLCAGSGAMGLEAVSRGATGAAFGEAAGPALAALRSNIAEVERRAKAQQLAVPLLQVIAGELPQSLGRLSKTALAPFAVVFIDPPYKQAVALAKASFATLLGLTTADAVLVVETAAADGPALLEAAPRAWSLVKQRAYGDTMLTILTKDRSASDAATEETDAPDT